MGRGGYRVAALLSGDVVEKGAAVIKMLLLLPLLAIVRLRTPWLLLRAKPAGARAFFIHHIAWLGYPVRTASYCQQTAALAAANEAGECVVSEPATAERLGSARRGGDFVNWRRARRT